MIDNGNGTFTIENVSTGEKKTVNASDLPQYGLSAPSSGKDSPIGGVIGQATRGGSDFLRNIGLGFIPNIAANTYDIGGGVRNMVEGKGKISAANSDYNNPFRTKQELQQTLQTNPFVSAGKDTAGAAGWLAGGPEGGLLVRGATGAVQGGLQGISQPNATPASVATDAGTTALLNSVLPGMGEALASGLGRTALGKGGEKLPQILRASGNRIMGGASDIKNNLYDLTAPIRDNLTNILSQSSAGIAPSEIFGKTDDLGIKTAQGLLDKLAGGVGHTEKSDAADYIHTLRQSLPVSASLNMDTPLPLSFWNDFLHGVGRDVGNKWVNLKQGKFVPGQDMIGSKLYGWLKNEIANRSGDPATVNKLNELLKATTDINGSLGKKEAGGSGIFDMMKNLGLPIEVISALALGHPVAAAGGLGAKIATSPKIATPLINMLASPQARGAYGGITRLGGAGASSQLESQQ